MPEANRQAIRRINEQITRLTPAILGSEPKRAVSLEAEEGVKVDLLAREGPDGLYLFAVNYDERLRPATARIRVEGLAAGSSVTVVDEDRAIKADAATFADAFEPLAVHIYHVAR